MVIHRKKITAADEFKDVVVDDVEEVEVPVIDPEASELLFETEDVAELVAEVTGETVEVTVEDTGEVTFAIGEDEFVVEPDGDEEVLESRRTVGKRTVKGGCGSKKRVAGTKGAVQRRPVKSSKGSVKASRTIRKIPKK